MCVWVCVCVWRNFSQTRCFFLYFSIFLSLPFSPAHSLYSWKKKQNEVRNQTNSTKTELCFLLEISIYRWIAEAAHRWGKKQRSRRRRRRRRKTNIKIKSRGTNEEHHFGTRDWGFFLRQSTKESQLPFIVNKTYRSTFSVIFPGTRRLTTQPSFSECEWGSSLSSLFDFLSVCRFALAFSNCLKRVLFMNRYEFKWNGGAVCL